MAWVNSGLLFHNKKPGEGDYWGKLDLDNGVQYRLEGDNKRSDRAGDYIKLSISLDGVEFGTGALFKNTKKNLPKHPDHTGKATINGRELYVSGWDKAGAKGPFISLALTPVEQAAEDDTPF